MQADLKRAMLATTKPNEKARLAEAWDALEERKRILRGKPLPGSLTHEKVKRRARMQHQPVSALAEQVDEQFHGPCS